jgi:hypothetical protein
LRFAISSECRLDYLDAGCKTLIAKECGIFAEKEQACQAARYHAGVASLPATGSHKSDGLDDAVGERIDTQGAKPRRLMYQFPAVLGRCL